MSGSVSASLSAKLVANLVCLLFSAVQVHYSGLIGVFFN